MPKSRSCGLLKWEKGKSYSKFLDKLANGKCHSVYRQLPFGLLAIAIRSTGKCRSVTSNGVRNAFTQGCMETGRLKCFQNSECVFPESGAIQPMGDADGGIRIHLRSTCEAQIPTGKGHPLKEPHRFYRSSISAPSVRAGGRSEEGVRPFFFHPSS